MPQDVRASRRLRTRPILLFLAAIGLPCLVLVGLSLRMLAQERELAEKRITDERQRIVTEVRQELLARLEGLRLRSLGATGIGASLTRDDRRAIALVARIDGDRLVLPWEAATDANGAILMERPFADTIRSGERSELLLEEFDAAVNVYRRAEAEARVPVQGAFARLLRGRALTKAGRSREALSVYEELLAVPPFVVDDQGIPFAFYAVRRLLDGRALQAAGTEPLFDALRGAVETSSGLAPVAVYMLDDLATELFARGSSAERERQALLRNDIATLKSDLEQGIALQRAFPSLLPRATAGSGGASPWVAFGEADALWLVTPSTTQPPAVVAVRATPLLASLDVLGESSLPADGTVVQTIALHGDGEPLGPSFPALSVVFAPADAAVLSGANSLQRSFYLAALVLVVSMTLFGAYLFWRDVQREVRLADMRSQFVSSVSHELKTPLTAIRMFAETLLMGRSVKPDTKQEYLETIVNESERLTRLLNNVLDFSKIEQGRKTYRLEPQSLHDIADAAVKAMQYPLLQQGFDLTVTVDEALPLVAADADAIQQAILNLLSNAMKFSGDSRIIELNVSSGEGHAVIAVRDRGLGIPASEHERIFEKFYRISAPAYDRIPGTGLGLTLVDHVARAHGGMVTVASAPGEGSTLSILLPLTGAPVEPSREEALA